jgi:elongation factor 2
MPRFKQTTKILELMKSKEHIRNIGIIAHIDHGKTTLTDALLADAGMIPQQIAGTARVLDYLEEEQKRKITIKTANISLLHEPNNQSYVTNLVDTPGHVDFTGKVARALRTIDGAIVVVDAVEEIMAQTMTVTRQALEERVRPMLFINKVDRLIRELKLSTEEIQDKFARIIRDFNMLIENYTEPQFAQKWKVNPRKRTIVFGSALHRWGFTLNSINQKDMKFTDVTKAYQKGKHEELSRQLPLAKEILGMTTENIPNPVEAQKYRIPKIWKGNLDSEMGMAMLECDDEGPTAISITNVQSDPQTGINATGRIFSGTIKEGDSVYFMEADKTQNVREVAVYMGAFREKVDQIPAGNIAALVGLNQAWAGETIISPTKKRGAVPFERIKYASEPVITVAVEPKSPADLPHMLEALSKLAIEDPNLVATLNEETGQYLLSGMGELHLEISLKLLRDKINAEMVASEPTVEYQESITEKGSIVMTKSQNKRNQFWIQAEPAERNTPKTVWISDKHGNVLVNLTEDVENLTEAKEAIISGFQWACQRGPLCEMPIRNVKAKLIDAEIAEDVESREQAQITRAVSRAVLGSFLTAKPVLLEPVYAIEISVPTRWMGECTNILTRRRGKVSASQQKGELTLIAGVIPVSETFELAIEMRAATSGYAFWQCTFDRWEKTPENIAAEIITQIRSRKGLPLDVPRPDKFIDGIRK